MFNRKNRLSEPMNKKHILSKTHLYNFGPFSFDPEDGVLYKDGQPQKMENQTRKVLQALIYWALEKPGEYTDNPHPESLEKSKFIDIAWEKGKVKASLPKQIQLLRNVLQDVKPFKYIKMDNGKYIFNTKIDEVSKKDINKFAEDTSKTVQRDINKIIEKDVSKVTEETILDEKQIEILCKSVNARLENSLNKDKEGEFFQKYINNIYSSRGEAENKFRKFIGSKNKSVFVVVSGAGKGKTTLLCHLAEQLSPKYSFDKGICSDGQFASYCLPLLFSASELDFKKNPSESDSQKLEPINALEEIITKALSNKSYHPKFTELMSLLRRKNILLVVFIDALNELRDAETFKEFNSIFNSILTEVNNEALPLLFCLSCRYEFWSTFTKEGLEWTNKYIFSLASDDVMKKITHFLEDFDENEIDKIVESYFYWYGIDGKLSKSARKSCCDPLMLRYFCSTCTNRSPDDKTTPPQYLTKNFVGEVTMLRRKEAFDKFAGNRREIIKNKVDPTNTYKDGDLYNNTTRYLLNISKLMYENRSPYITLQQINKLARELKHPDYKEGIEYPKLKSLSVLSGFVDEGLILEKVSGGLYGFVFEAYFEYSLGRYIALERWPTLKNKENKIDVSKVKEDFISLVKEHNELANKKNFTNLFGALSFAIQVVEEHEIYQTLNENGSYLFIDLIELMINSKEGRLDWIQQACATIRELNITHVGNSNTLMDMERRGKFNRLLLLLNNLTLSSDFVIMWDVRNLLAILAEADFELTLSRVVLWATNGKRLQPIFAIESLPLLGNNKKDNIYVIFTILLELLEKNIKEKSNFWYIKSIVYAIFQLIVVCERHEISLPIEQMSNLRNIMKKLAFNSSDGTIRRLVTSILPMLNLTIQGLIFDEIFNHFYTQTKETDIWVRWNFVFGLDQLAKNNLQIRTLNKAEEEVLKFLQKSIEHESNFHVKYAIIYTANSFEEEKSSHITNKIKKLRWHPKVKKIGLELGKNPNLTGIVYSPIYLEPNYDNHVECRERVQVIVTKLETLGEKYFNWLHPRMATDEELSSAHNENIDRHRDGSKWLSYIKDVEQASKNLSKSSLMRDIASGPSELRYDAYKAALFAAGGVLCAIDYVLEVESIVPAAFVLNRPPGHLANNTICIFNNIAIGAKYAINQYDIGKVLIIDCDAHHGMHTCRVFLKDPTVVYFSMHIQGEYAKEEGQVEHTGEGDGEGYTFNVPYPENMSDEGYKYIIDNLLYPVALGFKPDLILISAGFDGHFEDMLTPDCILTEEAYIHLAKKIRDIADTLNIKVIAALEGGYGLSALANCFAHMVNILGKWGIDKNEIGRVPLPENYDQMCCTKGKTKEDILEEVKKLVKKRVTLMSELKRIKPNYVFDMNTQHWRELLEK